MSNRVLIITYYWPPSAGSGVQRWLKFSKYLPEFGWEPVVFTPENPDFDLKDESLLNEINAETEVLKFPIWEPYNVFRSLKKERPKDTSKILEKKNKSLMDSLAIWLRANLLIPDPRVFWVRPSVNFLKELIDQGQFKAIITTGPPHSLHLIGRNLKRKTGIPWLADFRDPWSEWEFLDTLPMMKFTKRIHLNLERSVLREADGIIAISPTYQHDLAELAGKPVSLITNGFDETDLPEDWTREESVSDTLEIVYTGVIDAIRNPVPFLKAMKKAFYEKPQKIKLTFVGKVADRVQEYIRQDSWLIENVVLAGYVSHEQVFDYYRKANILLLILTDTKNAKGNIPGKLFEYLATGRPILALGDPSGDSAHLIAKCKGGAVFRHTDISAIQSHLEKFRYKDLPDQNTALEEFSRKKLTEKLAKLLDEKANPISGSE